MMMRGRDKEKSERLIPAGTEDSAAIGAEEIERLNKMNANASSTANNANVTQPWQQSQQQVQLSHQVSTRQPPQPNPTASARQQPRPQPKQRKSTGANTNNNTRQAQVQRQLATNDDEESYVYEPKKGHKLCFFICDTKRAVLLLSSFDFFILALSMTRNWKTARANGIGFDMSNEFTKKFVTQACALFVDIAVIVGALWYSFSVVLVGFLFKIYTLVVSSISAAQNWQDDMEFIISVAVLTGLNVLFLYASAVFMWETYKGILTKETYQKREKYSCCCEC